MVYSGAFDEFKDLHRAQYFNMQAGESVNNIERIIKYGNAAQSNGQEVMSLFGDMGMPEIPVPKILPCDEWSLIEKLEKEKEVTGIFISGHPLDRFKFEMMHYGIMTLAEFNELKAGTEKKPAVGRNYRIAGLVTNAQHRLTKTGREFGIITLEDFTEKSEVALWSDDYIKFKNYVEAGLIVTINGHFKQRYNSDLLEFKIVSITLMDDIKKNMTQNIDIKITNELVTPEFVSFVANNINRNKGRTAVKFKIYDSQENIWVNLFSTKSGVEMNDELCDYLLSIPDIEVNVGLVG